MNAHLSDQFPKMTDEEFRIYQRHQGHFIVSWFDPQVNNGVASKHMSIRAFLDKNGLGDSAYGAVERSLNTIGKFEITNEHGTFGIYRQTDQSRE